MTALRMNNSKETLIQGMRLLHGILDVLAKPDARKILSEAVTMSEDEVHASQEARSYVESAQRLRAEIAAERAEADQKIAESKTAIQDAKGAIAASKKTLTENEMRLKLITDRHDKEKSELSARDTAHAEEKARLAKIAGYLEDQAQKQAAKQTQLDELEAKLRGKAAQAAEIMKGV